MQKEKGQILLIVILVIIVASTIGLSLASRSITSLRSSTEEAESQKALAAAEAGIERTIQGSIPIALSEESNFNPDGTVNSKYSTTVDQVNSSSFLINGGNVIPKDEGADVWFVKHKDNGDLDYLSAVDFKNFLHLYWGSSSDGCSEAAIQAVVVTRNPSLPDTSPDKIKSYRYVYDGCLGRRTGTEGNKFTGADSVSFLINGVTFNNRTKANDLASGINGNSEKIILMRVIPIYKDAVIGINACNPSDNNNGCTALPSQGYVISSTGTSGQASKKITVFKGYPQTYLPYLSYGLFVAN